MKTLLRLVLLPAVTAAFVAGWMPGDAKAPTQPTEGPRWPRRILMSAGCAALVAGMALLGMGFYQLTRQEPQHAPGANVAVLSFTDVGGTIYDRALPATPAPTPSPSPAPPSGPGPAAPPLRDSPYRIVMPKIGVDAQVVTYGLDENAVPEVPYNGWEVAWYDFSAKPGTGSNAVFAGHVTWNGRAVFYGLDQLAAGDDVILQGTDGTRVSYKVTELFLVDENDQNALSVMGPTATDTITIITCGGSPYYVGGIAGYDYTHRLVVRGSLAGIEPAGGVAGAQAEPVAGG